MRARSSRTEEKVETMATEIRQSTLMPLTANNFQALNHVASWSLLVMITLRSEKTKGKVPRQVPL